MAATVTDLLRTVGSAALASQFKEVEFRSALFPPVVVSSNELLDDSEPSWVVRLVKPTVIFRDHAGREPLRIAPGGEAVGGLSGFFVPLAVVAGAFAVGYFVGKTNKRSR